MNNEALDLCEVVDSYMIKIGLKPEHIEKIKNERYFKESIGKPDAVQKTLLGMAFYNIFLKTQKDIPVLVRMAIVSANTITDWLDDVLTIILPFIKQNEDDLF